MESKNSIKIQVLLVENDPSEILSTKNLFTRASTDRFEISTAQTLAEAVQKIEKKIFDAIILDLNLPGSCGLDAFHSVHQAADDTPIIIISQVSEDQMATTAMQQGAQDYLVKGDIPKGLINRTIQHAIERKKIEKKLERSKKNSRLLIEHNRDGILLVDLSGKIKRANSAAIHLFNSSKENLVGSDFGFPISKEKPVEIRLISRKVEDVFVEMSANTVFIDNEQVFLCSLRDITKRKIAEDQLEKKNQELERLNLRLEEANKTILEHQQSLIDEERLKVILQMAGAAAHELNQPLMILTGNIEILEMDKFHPDAVKKRVPKIKKAAQRLSDTIKKIQTIDQYKEKKHDGKTQILDIDNRKKLLCLEPSDTDFKKIEYLLANHQSMILIREKTIASLLQRIEMQQAFDVILFAFSLPDGTGFDFLSQMKDSQCNIPAICITGSGNEKIAARLIKEGAHDYLSKKDLTYETLRESIDSSIEKDRLEKDLNRALNKLAILSTHDELTDLYNRRYMNEILDYEFDRTLRYDTHLSSLLLDLDFFKQVNDNYGHACGDMVLKEFSDLLLTTKRHSDYAFRYGGEEFLLLLPQTDIEGAQMAAKKLINSCRTKKYIFNDQLLTVTVSIGISEKVYHGINRPADLIAFADSALYEAKAQGRDCSRIFNKEIESTPPQGILTGGRGLGFLKQQLSAILLKTKTSSVDSIESLVKNIGGLQDDEENNRIKTLVSLLCKKNNVTETESKTICRAASLYNGFKVLLGEDILLKKEALDEVDKERIKHLPYLQTELANQFDFFSQEKSVLLHHTEWYDGTGYPEGLSKDEIPLGARIFSITNALVAMTSDRPYRSRMSDEEAVVKIVKNSGTQFDPDIAGTLLDLMHKNGLIDVSDTFIKEKINILSHTEPAQKNMIQSS